MSEPERKSLRVEIKDAEKGIVTAAISKFDVVDHDGDLTLSGAFGEQKVAVSSYGHNSWMGSLPVGRGTVKEKDDEAIAELKFFMTTQHGKEHFDVIKEMGDLQEWSYGFDVVETGEVTEEMRQLGIRRVIKKVKVHEVSPVLKGAGVGTRTLSVKNAETAGEEPVTKTEEKTGPLVELVKKLRDERDLPNGDLAEMMRISSTEVTRFLKGGVRPSLRQLERLAERLKTSVSRLRSAAEEDGYHYGEEDEARSLGAAAKSAHEAATKAEELYRSAAAEARAAIEAKTAAEAEAAVKRAEGFQTEAKSEIERFNRNMERYHA